MISREFIPMMNLRALLITILDSRTIFVRTFVDCSYKFFKIKNVKSER